MIFVKAKRINPTLNIALTLTHSEKEKKRNRLYCFRERKKEKERTKIYGIFKVDTCFSVVQCVTIFVFVFFFGDVSDCHESKVSFIFSVYIHLLASRTHTHKFQAKLSEKFD